ncbi:MAG: translation initiation factor IF-2 N-terminal domain-containing protein, partial [Elusimicrobiaceae bacterium]|nr:translation initiation factor IF-2 N-terminal domain-containing protein [Elusimicrobiaceae bacterium]
MTKKTTNTEEEKTTKKKPAAKKTTAKKAPAKKTTATKTVEKKAPAKKTAVKKTVAKKTTTAKTTAKKKTAPAQETPKAKAVKPAVAAVSVKQPPVQKNQISEEKPVEQPVKVQPVQTPKPAPKPVVQPQPVVQAQPAPAPVPPAVEPKPAVQTPPQPAGEQPHTDRHGHVKSSQPQAAPKDDKTIRIVGQPTVKELAEKMNIKTNDFIKKLMMMGIFATINQRLEKDMIELIVDECGFKAEMAEEDLEQETLALMETEDAPESLQPRSPVITIMGHVDHGKTSLLDAIRKSNVVAGEAGAITQHIGAYRVKTPRGVLTFLDTPGHEAFTAMRARGAQATDIVVLVVSATDGIMPQTIEAMEHAKAAKAPIIVAVNKIDLPGANPDRVKQDLAARGLVPEEWQGSTIFVEISAKKNINIDKLLEMIALQAEIMELKANPNRPGVGVILESKRDNKRGVVATV